MKFILASTTAILAATSISASAQETDPSKIFPPVSYKVNEEIWQTVETKGGLNYVHKPSGAICPDDFRDLTFSGIKDFQPTGNDSACEFEKKAEAGLSRMTLYIYQYKGLTGPVAYKTAKDSINQIGQVSNIKVTHQKGESQTCHKAIVPRLGAAILERQKKDKPDETESSVGWGVATYDFESEDRGAQTSLLSVYQTGDWIVKARVTIPSSETSYADACRYAGLASIGLASVISAK